MTAINLANQHGSEGKLGQAFHAENDRFGKAGRGLRLFAFDFHAICGGTRYDRCARLADCKAGTSMLLSQAGC